MNRWILAFDQGCSACRDIIGSVQAAAGGKLEARGLNDPEVHELRHQAMGESPPWAPTLLHTDSASVRAWTGPAMSVRLARLLGPVRSARVVRAIARSNVLPDPQRRSLLKAIPGLAVGVFVLSGGTAHADNNEARRIKRVGGPRASSVISAAEHDNDLARLREHLAEQNLHGPQWEVLDLYEGKRLVRTVAVGSYGRVGDDRVSYVGYGIEANGDLWRLALVHQDQSSYAVSVDASELVTTTLEPQAKDYWKCFACKGLCLLGCTGSCGGMCFVVCGGNPLCALACGAICSSVCGAAGCADAVCNKWCKD